MRIQHQMECQQEIANENDPKTAQQTSHRGHGSVFSSRDSQQTADFRYIEVNRGYSPTLEFEDDSAESLERNITLNVFSRGERSAFSCPPGLDQRLLKPGLTLMYLAYGT